MSNLSGCGKVMHKIGILSDTHGLLRPEVIAVLDGCEVILHGGDINKQKILDQLAQIARKHHISQELSEQIMRMYMTHPGVDKDGILSRIGL